MRSNLRCKVNPNTYGTSYFTSKSAAVRYYKDYEGSIEDAKHAVEVKLREGSIHIGKPSLKPGERLGLTDGGKRYTITEAPKIPNGRLVPARIKHNGKTYTGKVKRVNGKVKIFVTPEVARKINPESVPTFSNLPIGAKFRFSPSIPGASGGGRFLGQNEYQKTGARTYIPADIKDAEERFLKLYSGYPDILKKLKGPRLRKSLTLKVGSGKAMVERL